MQTVLLYIFRFVRPICLPVLTYSMSRSEFKGQESIVSGWGLHTFTPVINGHGPYAQRLKVSTGSRYRYIEYIYQILRRNC